LKVLAFAAKTEKDEGKPRFCRYVDNTGVKSYDYASAHMIMTINSDYTYIEDSMILRLIKDYYTIEL
jgi:hypothetical protein